MPKVTEEYMESKRSMIVDCAYQVCLRKPVEMVTISDVIAETGMSQGAIYRYYAGLDDILADMLTRMRGEYNIIDSFEEILADKKTSVEDLLYRVCDTLAEAMMDHISDIQKINFDLGVITINEPERASRIMAKLKGTGNLEYLGQHAMPLLIEGACKRGYHPAASPEEIGAFFSASYSGIEKYCIMAHCYGTAAPNLSVEPKKLFRTLASATIMLFGGKVNE